MTWDQPPEPASVSAPRIGNWGRFTTLCLAYQRALALVRDAADPILESEVRSDAGVAQAFAAEERTWPGRSRTGLPGRSRAGSGIPR